MILHKILISILMMSLISTEVFSQQGKTIRTAEKLLEQQDLNVYHGLIKYLIFDVKEVSKRPGKDEKTALNRLESWVKKIQDDPQVITKLRGPQEWAYISPADGSGQPFMITIPQDYDGQHAMPLSVYMHGYSGNHSEHYNGSDSLKGIIEVSVLGRSRGGGYTGLSGADVVHVINYVQENWKVDPDRIHIRGGSMGGNGTFAMGCRYPHWFASARPTCGFASDKPIENMLTLPVYATHSDDDFTVPVQHDLGPMKRLTDCGGQAILDITTGLGHAAWDYKEGNKRAYAWFKQQIRPKSNDIRHIRYSAFDGNAMRSWWAEVEEWGDRQGPADFQLVVNDNNMVYARLENINQLKIRVNESPIDPSAPLKVSVNGSPLISLDSPVPDNVYLQKKEGNWIMTDQKTPSKIRLHTPGGPNLLYNGEPLLIVYGTTGSKQENEAMKEAAKVASMNTQAIWQSSNGDYGVDSIPHNYNLYGHLNVKADVEVNEKDIQKCHLVLIGTANQNKLVASIADKLPVTITDTEIKFSDGETYKAEKNGVGLVYYNPIAPDRLIFWVASNDKEVYRVNSPVPQQMAYPYPVLSNYSPGSDCMVSRVDRAACLAVKNFDSNWNWISREKDAAVIPESVRTDLDFYDRINKAIIIETAADFSFIDYYNSQDPDDYPVIPGVTRVGDLANIFFYEPIGIIKLKGSELIDAQSKLENGRRQIFPVPVESSISADKYYTLAIHNMSIWTFVGLTQQIYMNYTLTDHTVKDAIEKFFINR